MIIRLDKRNRERFTVISNRLMADVEDRRISVHALGLLVYLLSKPDDWEVRPSALSRATGLSVGRLRALLSELAGAGYARLEVVYDAVAHRARGKRWVICEEPLERPQEGPESRLSEKQKVCSSRNSAFHGQLLSTDTSSLKTEQEGRACRALSPAASGSSAEGGIIDDALGAEADTSSSEKDGAGAGARYARKPTGQWNAGDLLAYWLDQAARRHRVLITPRVAMGRHIKTLLEKAAAMFGPELAPQAVRDLIDHTVTLPGCNGTGYLLYEAERFWTAGYRGRYVPLRDGEVII